MAQFQMVLIVLRFANKNHFYWGSQCALENHFKWLLFRILFQHVKSVYEFLKEGGKTINATRILVPMLRCAFYFYVNISILKQFHTMQIYF